ncbi:MAG: tetratricopeptide repeat protein [Flavobacteriales bacterium]|nr:tetratricopeptide repeat protein [Flavobacteriales bacterium]
MNQYQLEDQLLYADQLIKENKNAEAIDVLEAIIAEAPDFGKAYNHLGFIFETKYQDYTKAEEYYKLALKFAPNYTPVYYNYAIVLSTLKKWQELEALLRQAETIPTINRATIANEYAIMYEMRGMYDKAILKYKEYINYVFDNKQIDNALDSIERCERKKEMLK